MGTVCISFIFKKLENFKNLFENVVDSAKYCLGQVLTETQDGK